MPKRGLQLIDKTITIRGKVAEVSLYLIQVAKMSNVDNYGWNESWNPNGFCVLDKYMREDRDKENARANHRCEKTVKDDEECLCEQAIPEKQRGLGRGCFGRRLQERKDNCQRYNTSRHAICILQRARKDKVIEIFQIMMAEGTRPRGESIWKPCMQNISSREFLVDGTKPDIASGMRQWKRPESVPQFA
ncbi:hypothetical protein BD560DRAFT_427574 [Blakeslea trispora]|nr:hypothetical protein BD560DRAFT_427574 [Blakeslea trispora]